MSDNQPLASLVRALQLRTRLSYADQEAILALSVSQRVLEPLTYLVREADPPGDCAIMLSGFSYRSKLAGNGGRQILSIQIPGDPVDFQNLFLDVSDHSVQMLTRGEVACVSRSALQTLFNENPSVAHAITVMQMVEAAIFREWIVNVGRRDARTRIVHLLCELAVRLEAYGLTQDYGYELPMTQEQIGDAVGLTAVHVNRTLKALESEKLIRRTKRNVSFPDWERLRAIGDFNDRYLHFK